MAIQVNQSGATKLKASQYASESSQYASDNSQSGAERKPFKRLNKLQLFKTEMCKNFNTSKGCIYGEKCQYAHGLEDLRVRETPGAYKTRVCVTFAKTGRCPYGTRCRFVHGDADEQQVMAQRKHAMAREQTRPMPETDKDWPNDMCTEFHADPEIAMLHSSWPCEGPTVSLLGSSWPCGRPRSVPETTTLPNSPPTSPFIPVPLAEVTNHMPPALALEEMDAKNDETFGDESVCPQINLQALSLLTQENLGNQTNQTSRTNHQLAFAPEHNTVASLPAEYRSTVPLPLQRLGSSGASNSFRRYHNNVDAELQAPTLHVRETSFLRIVNRLADVLDDDADQLISFSGTH